MTPETASGLRSLFTLRAFSCAEDPGQLFKSMAGLSAWSFKQKSKPSAEHDAMLAALDSHNTLYTTLIVHMATIDIHFFDLAKRMIARSLVRHNPPSKLTLHMAASLLTSSPPQGRKPQLASHVAMVLGIAIAQDADKRPTAGISRAGPPERSGCGSMVAELSKLGQATTYSAVETVWKNREKVLLSANFTLDEVSAFFAWFSPMK